MIATTPIAPLPRITMQAYCEYERTRALLGQVVADPRMTRAQASIVMGGLSAAVDACRETASPHLLLVESSASRDVLLAQLDDLAECCEEGTKVVVIGDVNDIVLYRELMARGVSEYVVHPFTAADLVRLVSGLYAHPSQRLVGRVIAVTGVKGGVGASTFAHNLAVTMARFLEQQVILADLDMPFGTAGLNLNQEPPTTLAEAVEAADRVDANYVERLMARCEERLSLLASPAMIEAAHDIGPEGFDAAIDAMRSLAPVIVLDLPHGWPEWKRHVLLSAEEVVLVAEPDLANLRNAKNMFDFLRNQRPNDLEPRLVLNKAGLAKRPEISAADFERALAVAPSAVINHDAKLFGTAANNGQMLCDVDGSAKVTEALRQCALALTGRVEAQAAGFSLFNPLFTRLRARFA